MSTMFMVDEQLGKVASPNRYYNAQRTNWRFLLASYLGGEDYRRYQYLTRYQSESDAEYGQRLNATPLENHCKSVVNVYNSFLFKESPERDFGSLAGAPEVADFLKDADLEGRSLNAFMKDVSTWASVFGHCWILATKPNVGAVTRADEIASGVRPYVSLLTPLVVIDWHWERLPSGQYDLRRVKYVEEVNGSVQTIKEWRPDTIHTWNIDYDTRDLISEYDEPNGLGYVPMVCVYSQRSMARGLGVSDIQDIADMQKFIYNQLSEVEQAVRIDNHPSLVKDVETQASAGAGSIINMPANMDPGLKPYLLETSGAQIASIYQAITQAVDSIDKMANTGSVRATQAKLLSGIAMQTEFQLLNAKLAEKADNLELAEEQMWRIFADYLGQTWDGCVKYQDSYNLQDKDAEYAKLQAAKTAATAPETLAIIDQKLIQLLCEDEIEDEYNMVTVPVTEVTPQPPAGVSYDYYGTQPQSAPDTYQRRTFNLGE